MKTAGNESVEKKRLKIQEGEGRIKGTSTRRRQQEMGSRLQGENWLVAERTASLSSKNKGESGDDAKVN